MQKFGIAQSSPEQRRRDADADGLGHVIADDRQTALGGGGIEGEHAVVVGRSLEERRQHHDAVRAAVGGVPGARHHVLDHQRGGLDDDLGAPGNDLRAARDQRVGLLAREVDVHAGAGAEDEAVDAGGDVALEVVFERVEVDPPFGVEGRGDCEVKAGEGEVGHGQRLSAPERSSQMVLSWVYWSWAWTELSRPPKPDWR